MKTLRISLFFIFGAIFTFHSFAQEVKKERKAQFKMELIDDDGNKKVIDTTFTFDTDQDYTKIMRQIKMDVGFSEEEIAKMKSELHAHAKEMTVDIELLMEGFDMDKMHEHMMIVREEMHEGKVELQKALEELKVELESMKMNEKAMKKLNKAMKKLHQVEWAKHVKQLKVEMKELHEHIGEEVSVFVMDGKHMNKKVWLDDDEKHILIDVSVDCDNVTVTKKHNVIFIGDHKNKDKNVWVEKDGEKIIIKTVKGGGNMVFFGDDADLEEIHEIDSKHKVIIRKLKGEAKKGDVIFISDDAHMIREFKDENGNVKVMRFKMKSGDDTHGYFLKEERNLMIIPAGDDLLAKADEKGILDAKAEVLKLNGFTLNLDNDKTSIGTTFEEKGKLKVKLFDADMNQIWDKSFGKVSGEWSTEIPADVLKESGKYFVLFNHGKKAKLLMLLIR